MATTKTLKDITGQIVHISPSNMDEIDISDLKNSSTDTFVKQSELDSGLSAKVDKVTGKGLSTNDLTDELKEDYDDAVSKGHIHANKDVLDGTTASFTSEEKTKLEGLENYDDTEVKESIAEKLDKIGGTITGSLSIATGQTFKADFSKITDVDDNTTLKSAVESWSKQYLQDDMDAKANLTSGNTFGGNQNFNGKIKVIGEIDTGTTTSSKRFLVDDNNKYVIGNITTDIDLRGSQNHPKYSYWENNQLNIKNIALSDDIPDVSNVAKINQGNTFAGTQEVKTSSATTFTRLESNSNITAGTGNSDDDKTIYRPNEIWNKKSGNVHTLTLPNKSGTIALLSDITGGGLQGLLDFNSIAPYPGATSQANIITALTTVAGQRLVKSTPTGYGNIAVGRSKQNTTPTTQSNCDVVGAFNLAMGNKCTAKGLGCFSFGGTNVSGNKIDWTKLSQGTIDNDTSLFCASFGENNTTTGRDAFTIGQGNTNSGYKGFVSGLDNTNSGENSYIGGYDNTNSGTNCIIFGRGLTNTRNNKTAFGLFNENKDNVIFEIGNGVDDEDRRNALDVYADGHSVFQKQVTITDGGLKIGNTTLSEAQLQALLALLANKGD